MSAKPVSVLTWATSTNYPNDAAPEANTPTKVALTDQATLGWRPGAKPPAQILNTWNNHVGQWLQYISDGALDGSFSVSGDLELGGSVEIAQNLQVDGNADVDGDLEVDGDLTVAAIKYSAPQGFTINAHEAIDPAGTLTRQFNGGGWNVGTSIDVIIYPIKLPVGARLLSWSLAAQKQSGSGSIVAELYDGTGAGAGRIETQVGATQTNSAANPGAITLGQSGLMHTVLAAHTLFVIVHGGGTTGDYFNDLSITWDAV